MRKESGFLRRPRACPSSRHWRWGSSPNRQWTLSRLCSCRRTCHVCLISLLLFMLKGALPLREKGYCSPRARLRGQDYLSPNWNIVSDGRCLPLAYKNCPCCIGNDSAISTAPSRSEEHTS